MNALSTHPLGKPRDRALTLLAGLALVTLVAAISATTLSFDWVMFDDDINILMNPHLGRGAWSSVGWAWGQFDYIRRYLPLGWLEFDALLSIDGYNATIFHLASVALHAVNAGLIFVVFRRLLAKRSAPEQPVSVTLIAAGAALAWSIHPLRAENVGWISGLLYLGSTTFASLAVLLHLGPSRSDETPSAGRDLVALLAFTGSLLVYPVFLTLPVLLFWREATSANGTIVPTRRTGARLGPWLAVAAAVGGLNWYAATTPHGGFALDSVSGGGPLGWFGSRLAILGHYAVRTFWPFDLCADYGPIDQLFARSAEKTGLGLLVSAAVVLLALRRTRRTVLGWLIALAISLAPFLVQPDAAFRANDRYAVLWLAVCVLGGATVVMRLPRRGTALIGVVIAGALVSLGVQYHHMLQQWRTTTTLQARIDETNRDHPAFSRPAVIFWWLGDRAESARRLSEGLRRFPHSPSLLETQRALLDLERHWRDRVGEHTEIPPLAVRHVDLGREWLARGERSAAAAHFARALVIAPTYAEAAKEYRSAIPKEPILP